MLFPTSDRNMLLPIRIHNLRKLCTVPNIAFIENRGILVSETTLVNSSLKTHVHNHVTMPEVNSRLKHLVKTGHLHEARKMFDRMPQRDEISWTTIISGYVNAKNSREALLLFSKMWVSPGLSMDPFSLSIALKVCALDFDLNYGESLHGYLVKSGFVNSVFVGSALLDMYTKFGKIEQGIKVFDEMPIKNVVSWTAIITGLVHGGFYKKGLVYLSEMRKSGVEYDSYTLAIALKACAYLAALNFGREIHTHTVKRGFNDTSFVANSLSTMYNKCGKLDYGLLLFEKMSIRDVVSWTSVITTFVQMGEEKNAFEAFIRMQEAGVSPNEFTFATVISGCSGLVRISWGEQLHAHVLRFGLADSLSVANSLVTMYSKCGQISSASMVFHGMTRRDIISWSTIIAVYSQGGCGEEAFEYLSWMRKEGPKPTQFAFASVLSVCGNMAILEQGRQVHAQVLFVGLEQEAMIQSALINMYSKCGCIKEAERVFNEAENYDIVSWTAMINGYAEHGYIHETIDLFKMLSKVGLKPDSVTFIGLLTACGHAGLADLGFHYFNLMSSEYQISPSKEHYGCMIDLLCRAGRLTEAEHMIKSMPFHRDDVVWSTLLRACRIHGDVDCGRRTAEKLLEMDPNCAGTHITLANIYSAKGKWSEAADVRKMMRSKGVIKEPGWSWIKVKDRVSAFVAGERSYPEGEDIYGMLDLLASRVDITVQELGSLLDLED
ncbi:putative pentatricopeptide repeat-containing protein At3g47840 [Durio zibethinus]|uniref:Pentatricopeptide repeat-containing protein At3g47840 n=1 Tax=Durio zibethinus TaxID=66656 RepID=A0A6P5ZFW8_DURZI|nr:putative pentatricopeptide repeat-containing protein At3g47840 [Durio zibethinus]